MNPFWMVAKAPLHEWSTTAPTRRYASLDAATFAARGLARESGCAFVVLGVVATVPPENPDQSRLL
jgi:hypothetical protein